MRTFFLALVIVLVSSLVLAQGTLAELKATLSDTCYQVTTLLPVVAMLMVLVSGVIYTLGQFAGAEMRARASVWSQVILTSSLIAILIVVIAPPVLGAIYGEEVSCFGAGGGGGTLGCWYSGGCDYCDYDPDTYVCTCYGCLDASDYCASHPGETPTCPECYSGPSC